MPEELELMRQIAEQAGGKIEDVILLDDGSGFATMTMPLPEDHWIYGDRSVERDGYEQPPMPMRMGVNDPRRVEITAMLTKAARYAVRSATMKGKEMDFDPDALVQNLIVGMFGYHTPDGLSSDSWANPE